MFAVVADHGSFSAAAAELGCTQSRISHAIAELERDLDVLLLLRSHSGSAPTEAGRRVLDGVRALPLPIPARRQFVIATLRATPRGRLDNPARRAVTRLLREHAIVASTPAWRAGIVRWDQDTPDRAM